MFSKFFLFLGLTVLTPLLGSGQAFAQEQEDAPSAANPADASPAEAEEEPRMKVRFVALGHRRLAQFKRSSKARVVRLKGPDGEVIEETIAAGVPLEVMGERFEYLPAITYIPDKSKDGRKELITSPLSLNAFSPEQELHPRKRLDLFIRPPNLTGSNDEIEKDLERYASAKLGEKQTHVLVTLVGNAKSKETWKDPLVRTFDTSPRKLPPGSLLLFNGTPYPMEVQLPVEGEMETLRLKPLQARPFQPSVNKSGYTRVIARLVAKSGAKQQFFYNDISIPKDGRCYLFSYFDPRKDATSRAGMVQGADKVELPAATGEDAS